MSKQALALKYRPKTLSDVVEQSSVIKILQYMLDNKCWSNVMLFCGAAGCGKTTVARIMSYYINEGKGVPIEIDAASNNSVDGMRQIIEESKVKSIDSEYKVYILDEVHQFSNAAWQSFLKTCEEPPKRTIFILCTTDPQKIPNTIHSRVQRFDFNRITYNGIFNRLKYICDTETKEGNTIEYEDSALEYIAKLSEGGMRDAITNLDKALNYSRQLTVKNVIEALGLQDYDTFFELCKSTIKGDIKNIIDIIERTYLQGKDLKLFIEQYADFLLDICKYEIVHDYTYIQIPQTYDNEIESLLHYVNYVNNMRREMVQLHFDIKYESLPKMLIESKFFEMCNE